ncbi:MAG: hypothetical protein KGZ56_11135, partial [Dethiobacter sp.]|nr:hypothetical protein [Dethiobacter sp.]
MIHIDLTDTLDPSMRLPFTASTPSLNRNPAKLLRISIITICVKQQTTPHFLVAQDKRGFSDSLISEQLSVCYITAWTMLQSSRIAKK